MDDLKKQNSRIPDIYESISKEFMDHQEFGKPTKSNKLDPKLIDPDKGPKNLGELLNFYLKKYNLGNQNKYSAIMELKKGIRELLQRKLIEYVDLCDSTLICNKSVEYLLKDLGGSILPPKKELKKSGSSGRHMGTNTDEFLIEK